jgi:hypothetical protein
MVQQENMEARQPQMQRLRILHQVDVPEKKVRTTLVMIERFHR